MTEPSRRQQEKTDTFESGIDKDDHGASSPIDGGIGPASRRNFDVSEAASAAGTAEERQMMA